jgi:hypothetical protein
MSLSAGLRRCKQSVNRQQAVPVQYQDAADEKGKKNNTPNVEHIHEHGAPRRIVARE